MLGGLEILDCGCEGESSQLERACGGGLRSASMLSLYSYLLNCRLGSDARV